MLAEFHATVSESVFAVGMGCLSIFLDDLFYAAVAAWRARKAHIEAEVAEAVEPTPRYRKVARWVRARWTKHLERSWIADLVD